MINSNVRSINMYKLYYIPNACSLATQVILHELNQTVEIIDKNSVVDFYNINPVGSVPVLIDDNKILRESAAIIIYLLDKHESDMLARNGPQREQAIQSLMFANATMHPAYSRLFFIEQHIHDPKAKQEAFESAAQSINNLWQVVEKQLTDHLFMSGNKISAADILLTVYSRWGDGFPVDLALGNKTQKLIETVSNRPSFQRALNAEQEQQIAA